MAKMKRPIGDMVSGKLGNVVFYRMNGKSYVRSAPKRKKDAWTQEQQMYRQRISRAGALWRALKSEEFSRIWNTASWMMNGYAWFLKANMPALEMDGTLIDARLLKVSDGKLPMVQKLSVERVEGDAQTIRVSWQNDPHTRGERLKDELMAISYTGEQFSPVTPTGLQRSHLQGSFTLPVKPVNATHVFLFMASGDREKYSESVGVEI